MKRTYIEKRFTQDAGSVKRKVFFCHSQLKNTDKHG